MYYSAIGVLALLILFISGHEVLFGKSALNRQPKRVAYRRFLLAVSVYYVTDIFWGVLEHFKLAKLLYIDTMLFFLATAIGVLFWTTYLVTYMEENSRFGRFLLFCGRALTAALAVLVVLNCFVPVLFTVDASCAYKSLPARYAVLLSQIVLLLSVSGYALSSIVRHKENKTKYLALGAFGLIVASFLSLQIYFPYLPLYTVAYMLGTCLLSAFVVADEKAEFARNLEEATKIASLKKSLSSLLDNMPAMSYTKDMETGAYLACNQAFARYVQKASAADVVGLTDFELFEGKTAEQFLDYDNIALESERAVTYIESATDIAGNLRQFQTTKLKFYNEDGKLCILGMSLDITEAERMKRENAQTLQAYRETLQENAVRESIIAAMAQDYFNIFYVNFETEEYLEFGSRTKEGKRTVETNGVDFFRTLRENADKLVFEEDCEALVQMLNKENLRQKLAQNGVVKYYYRLMIEGVPTYVIMKITRIPGDEEHLVIGITNVDEEMKNRMAAEQAKEENKAYLRLSAFSRSLLVLYVIDPETDEYTEFSSTEDYAQFGIAKKGSDFFGESRNNAQTAVYSEDREHFFEMFSKENLLQSIALDGIFVLDYRLMIDGKPTYIRLKGSEVEEDGKKLLVIGIENVDRYVRREQQQAYDLSMAREQATKDALTGVKNHLAFAQAKRQLTEELETQHATDYAFVVCDINDLKQVNDTQGHRAGDTLIRLACNQICMVFRHSPVYRIGGDEFAVISHGHDYEHMDELLAQMHAANESSTDCAKIAFGMARGEEGATVEAVFETADQRMYAHKATMKSKF